MTFRARFGVSVNQSREYEFIYEFGYRGLKNSNDIGGTFVSDTPGTFESDTGGGTFNPLLSLSLSRQPRTFS